VRQYEEKLKEFYCGTSKFPFHISCGVAVAENKMASPQQHSICIRASEYRHSYRELIRDSLEVMVCSFLMKDRIIGPLFLAEVTVSVIVYTDVCTRCVRIVRVPPSSGFTAEHHLPTGWDPSLHTFELLISKISQRQLP
jgi:hypothetical protein